MMAYKAVSGVLLATEVTGWY